MSARQQKTDDGFKPGWAECVMRGPRGHDTTTFGDEVKKASHRTYHVLEEY